jgi:carbon storage regulator CsrA
MIRNVQQRGKEHLMLVLSRKVGEKIAIGDEIVLVINRVSGSRVSIGIEAPDHVRIVRGELSFDADPGAGPREDQCGLDDKISPGSKALAASCD